MKRIFTVLAVLLVTTALFAGVTLKAGGTFAFTDTKNVKSTNVESPFYEGLDIKMSGFGFNLEVVQDYLNNLVAYSGVAMVFPKDATFNNGSEEFLLSKRVKDDMADHSGLSIDYSLIHYSVSAGAAYKIGLKPLQVIIGGGISYNRSVAIIKYVYGLVKQEQKIEYFNIGLHALIDARFMFDERLGVGVTAIPQLGLYNISKYKATSSSVSQPTFEETVKGFKTNFTVPISVGVSYTF